MRRDWTTALRGCVAEEEGRVMRGVQQEFSYIAINFGDRAMYAKYSGAALFTLLGNYFVDH